MTNDKERTEGASPLPNGEWMKWFLLGKPKKDGETDPEEVAKQGLLDETHKMGDIIKEIKKLVDSEE